MKRTPRRPRRLLLATALLLPLLASAAEPYPSRPIRVVVPFGAGGTSDVVARLLSAKLSESLKQTVNVDPKPGANGIIGTDIVAKAAPDGYTLLLTVASAQTLTPALYKLPFDPVKDFARSRWWPTWAACCSSMPTCRRARCRSLSPKRARARGASATAPARACCA